MTLLVGMVCLVLVYFFPRKDAFQEIMVMVTFLLVLPALYIKFSLKKKLTEFGLQTGNWKNGIMWSVISLLVAFLIVYILHAYASLEKNYLVPESVRSNFKYFIGYEFLLVLPFVFLYEFFFRGFLLFSLEGKMGQWASVAQFAIFAGFLWATQSFDWQMLQFILPAYFAGIIVQKSRSIYYSFASGALFAIIMDAIIIRLTV